MPISTTNRPRWISMIQSGCAATMLCVTGGVLGSSPSQQAASMKVLPSPGRVYAGFYNIGDVSKDYGSFTELSDGHRPPIVFTFHDWNKAGIEAQEPVLQTFHDPMEGENETSSPLAFAERIAKDGAVLAVSWDAIGYIFEHPDYWDGGGNQPIKYADIFNGTYDHYIREVAQQVRDFGKPIMISPSGEFNALGFVSFGPDGNQYILDTDNDDLSGYYGDPDTPDGPERVRDMYRYIIDIFNEEGAHNVTWFMYSHSAYMNPDDFTEGDAQLLDMLHPRHYYPGDEYIDWIGNSAYMRLGDPDLNLGHAVSHAISAFREFTDKPFFIPEFGVEVVAEQTPGVDPGDSRAELIRDLFENQIPAHPDIRALTFADAELFKYFFGIPRLGEGEGEVQAWLDAVIHSDRYTGTIYLGNIPEPGTAVLSLPLLTGAIFNRYGRSS